MRAKMTMTSLADRPVIGAVVRTEPVLSGASARQVKAEAPLAEEKKDGGIDAAKGEAGVTPKRPRLSDKAANFVDPFVASSSNDDACEADMLAGGVIKLEYPKDKVKVPSKAVLRSLHEEAMMVPHSDSQNLSKYGLLSLEEVLLPAVAHQEEKDALKPCQARVQGLVEANSESIKVLDSIVDLRCHVYNLVGESIQAARENRFLRELQEADRQAQWEQAAAQQEAESKAQEDQKKKEDDRLRELEQAMKLRELKKQWPRNQEAWREVAHLMTELSKMQKEERMWKEMDDDLKKREAELMAKLDKEKARQPSSMQCVLDIADDDDGANATEDGKEEAKVLVQVDQAIDELTLSCTRIVNSLKAVTNVMSESDRVRKELYTKYKESHQFQGYQGVKDPKGLIRALSQSQDCD
jgi:hypothetical protein